jgi:hypothetical protein
VVIEVKKDHVDFRVGKELVARYNISSEEFKPYFWPVNAPGGIPVTRAWPMVKDPPGKSKDHVHQKSVWFCHGEIMPDGAEAVAQIGSKNVDCWGESPKSGRIVCTHVGEPKAVKGGAVLLTRNEWRSVGGNKVLDETRTIGLYDLGTARLIVLDIDLHASVVPVLFGDTKEGSLGLRVNDQISEKYGKGRLENAEGLVGAKAVWGLFSAWSDYSGLVNDREVGIAGLDDPKNRSPIAWHSRDYGLMAGNPFGRAKSGFPPVKGRTDVVKLAKGEHLKLRYGILIHLGNARDGKVAEHYKTFLNLR